MKIFVSSLFIAACSVAAAASAAQFDAAGFDVVRMPFGSGVPAAGEAVGADMADHVADGLYHAPNYLPGFPTAATIWPREVPVTCSRDAVSHRKTCTGYTVIPAIGRGEYIFVRPVEVPEPVKLVTPEPVPVPLTPAPVPVTRKKPLG